MIFSGHGSSPTSPHFWVNFNNSLTWIKAVWGWFPSLTMIPVRSQWDRYNLPSHFVSIFSCWTASSLLQLQIISHGYHAQAAPALSFAAPAAPSNQIPTITAPMEPGRRSLHIHRQGMDWLLCRNSSLGSRDWRNQQVCSLNLWLNMTTWQFLTCPVPSPKYARFGFHTWCISRWERTTSPQRLKAMTPWWRNQSEKMSRWWQRLWLLALGCLRHCLLQLLGSRTCFASWEETRRFPYWCFLCM